MNIEKPVKARNGLSISIQTLRDGAWTDTFVGDVYCYAPSANAINPKGRKMFSVWTRNRRTAVSYHKSEATALRAMRKTIRAYFE